jgi:hypothetical protein
MYADTTLAAAITTGLAAASEGETFHATGADVDYIGIYKDVSGVAVEQARYPTAASVAAKQDMPEGAPAYTNSGGQGDRTALISVSSSPSLFALGEPSRLVDGREDNAADAYVSFSGGATLTGAQYIIFDFGYRTEKLITEARWRQSDENTHGVWRWQGSNDGATWENIGGTFTLGGGVRPGPGLDTQTVHTELGANVTPYNLYRLLSVSGTTSSSFIREVDFKITGQNARPKFAALDQSEIAAKSAAQTLSVGVASAEGARARGVAEALLRSSLDF